MRKVLIALMVAALLAAGWLATSATIGVANPEKSEARARGVTPMLGVEVANLSPSLAQQLGIDRDSGVVIVRVQPGSPPEAAGLKAKDIITKVNGSPVATVSELVKAIRAIREAQGPVTLTILREGKEQDISVTPQPPQERQRVMPPAPSAPAPTLGVVVANLSPSLAQRLGIDKDSGVVIVQVQPGSPAETAGLKAKDIVTKVNGSPVATVSELVKAIREAQGPVTLTILREGKEQDISVTPQPRQEWQQVVPPAWLPELGGIKQKEQFEHFLGSQWTILDKGGQKHTITATPGVVQGVGDKSFTIAPNGQTQAVTFTVTDKTLIRTPGGKLETLKAGDQVTVVSVDNPQEARLILSGGGKGFLPRPAPAPRPGWHLPALPPGEQSLAPRLGPGPVPPNLGQRFPAFPSRQRSFAPGPLPIPRPPVAEKPIA